MAEDGSAEAWQQREPISSIFPESISNLIQKSGVRMRQ
jgi:hypothetical protein